MKTIGFGPVKFSHLVVGVFVTTLAVVGAGGLLFSKDLNQRAEREFRLYGEQLLKTGQGLLEAEIYKTIQEISNLAGEESRIRGQRRDSGIAPLSAEVLRSPYVALSLFKQTAQGWSPSWVAAKDFGNKTLSVEDVRLWSQQVGLNRIQGDQAYFSRFLGARGEPYLGVYFTVYLESGEAKEAAIALGVFPVTYFQALNELFRGSEQELILTDSEGNAFAYQIAKYLGSRIDRHPLVAQVLLEPNLSGFRDFTDVSGEKKFGLFEPVAKSNLILALSSPENYWAKFPWILLAKLAGLSLFAGAVLLFLAYFIFQKYLQTQSLLKKAINTLASEGRIGPAILNTPQAQEFKFELLRIEDRIETVELKAQSQNLALGKKDREERLERVAKAFYEQSKDQLTEALRIARQAKGEVAEKAAQGFLGQIEDLLSNLQAQVFGFMKEDTVDAPNVFTELKPLLIQVIEELKIDFKSLNVEWEVTIPSRLKVGGDAGQLGLFFEQILIRQLWKFKMALQSADSKTLQLRVEHDEKSNPTEAKVFVSLSGINIGEVPQPTQSDWTIDGSSRVILSEVSLQRIGSALNSGMNFKSLLNTNVFEFALRCPAQESISTSQAKAKKVVASDPIKIEILPELNFKSLNSGTFLNSASEMPSDPKKDNSPDTKKEVMDLVEAIKEWKPSLETSAPVVNDANENLDFRLSHLDLEKDLESEESWVALEPKGEMIRRPKLRSPN